MIQLRKKLGIFTIIAFLALFVILIPAWLSHPIDLKREISFTQTIPTEPVLISNLLPLPKPQWNTFPQISTSLYWLRSKQSIAKIYAYKNIEKARAVGFPAQMLAQPNTSNYFCLIGPFSEKVEALNTLKYLNQLEPNFDMILTTEKPDLHQLKNK